MGSSRRGFTLVELLVVITIIGILIALLLPAVQAAREAARRSQCTNNLKQLGLALNNYHSAYNLFPPAGLDYGAGNPSSCTGGVEPANKLVKNLHGLVLLLPYLEQQAVFDRINFRQCVSNAAAGPNAWCSATVSGSARPAAGDSVASGNAAAICTRITAFVCPSDAFTDAVTNTCYFYTSTAGLPSGATLYKTNYDFAAETNGDFCFWTSQSRKTRIFGQNSYMKIGDIVDGTSNTAAMNELTHLCRDNGGPDGNLWSIRTYYSFGSDLARDIGGPGYQGINVWKIPPSWWSWMPNTTIVGNTADQNMAASMHPGGENSVFADGAVRFLSQNTDFGVLTSISTPQGVETFAAPW